MNSIWASFYLFISLPRKHLRKSTSIKMNGFSSLVAKMHSKWWWLCQKVMSCSWEFSLSNQIAVLTVGVVSMKVNRRYYFQSNLCSCSLKNQSVGLQWIALRYAFPTMMCKWVKTYKQLHKKKKRKKILSLQLNYILHTSSKSFFTLFSVAVLLSSEGIFPVERHKLSLWWIHYFIYTYFMLCSWTSTVLEHITFMWLLKETNTETEEISAPHAALPECCGWWDHLWGGSALKGQAAVPGRSPCPTGDLSHDHEVTPLWPPSAIKDANDKAGSKSGRKQKWREMKAAFGWEFSILILGFWWPLFSAKFLQL